jgi:hypothetical protein
MRWRILLLAVGLCACNDAKVAQLEKENAELRKQVADSKHVDLATQEKCAAAGEQFMEREYPGDPDTLLIREHNHYNQTAGKCYVLVEWHYTSNRKTGAWNNFMVVEDVYEHYRYAEFSEHTDIRSDFTSHVLLTGCQVNGMKCTSVEEFNKQVQPFMSD